MTIWALRAYPYDPGDGERVVYASTSGWTSRPDEPDAAPNTYWGRLLEVPLRMEVSLFEGEAVGGASKTTTGSIVLANDQGDLDWWLNLAWDGRRIELYRCDAPAPQYLADFTLVMARMVEQLVPGDRLELILTDAQALFEVPARRGIFAGTGGIEGGETIKGRAKPFLLGRRRKFEPVLIDPALNIYLIDPAGIHALLDADDGGDPFTVSGGDTASEAALAALSMAGVEYATCLAEGLIRLAEPPLLRLRVSADGVAPDGIWLSTTADLARYAAITFGGIAPEAVADDIVSYWAAVQPAIVGYWHDGTSEMSVQQLIDALCAPAGMHWGVSAEGLFHVGRYDVPDLIASFLFSDRDFLSIEPRQAGRRYKSVRLGYRPTLALAATEIAGTVSDRQEVQRDLVWLELLTDPWTEAESLLSGELQRETLFDAEADALAEQARLLTVHGRATRPTEVEMLLTADTGTIRPGMTVMLQSARHGLSEGISMVVVKTVIDAEVSPPTITVTAL